MAGAPLTEAQIKEMRKREWNHQVCHDTEFSHPDARFWQKNRDGSYALDREGNRIHLPVKNVMGYYYAVAAGEDYKDALKKSKDAFICAINRAFRMLTFPNPNYEPEERRKASEEKRSRHIPPLEIAFKLGRLALNCVLITAEHKDYITSETSIAILTYYENLFYDIIEMNLTPKERAAAAAGGAGAEASNGSLSQATNLRGMRFVYNEDDAPYEIIMNDNATMFYAKILDFIKEIRIIVADEGLIRRFGYNKHVRRSSIEKTDTIEKLHLNALFREHKAEKRNSQKPKETQKVKATFASVSSNFFGSDEDSSEDGSSDVNGAPDAAAHGVSAPGGSPAAAGGAGMAPRAAAAGNPLEVLRGSPAATAAAAGGSPVGVLGGSPATRKKKQHTPNPEIEAWAREIEGDDGGGGGGRASGGRASGGKGSGGKLGGRFRHTQQNNFIGGGARKTRRISKRHVTRRNR